nr:MAG TPA: hypothetical protein [Microviridae sp.]
MKLEIKIRKGSKIETKVVEVSMESIFSMLSGACVAEVYKELVRQYNGNVGGFVVGLKDLDNHDWCLCC